MLRAPRLVVWPSIQSIADGRSTGEYTAQPSWLLKSLCCHELPSFCTLARLRNARTRDTL
jgi:hypothetical protein